MVGACQQNSGIFLVRGGEAGQGLGEMPVGVKAGLAAGSERHTGGGRGWDRARCRRPNHRGWRRENHWGRWRARSEMPAEAEAGLGAEPPGTG